MKIKSRQELYDYLNNFDWESKKDSNLSSVYFLIKYDDLIEAIYFYKHKDSWFESPCILSKFSLKDNELKEYISEVYELDEYLVGQALQEALDEAYQYELTFQQNGFHYEIDNFQTSPFLPDKIEIVKAMSETECLEWLRQRYSK